MRYQAKLKLFEKMVLGEVGARVDEEKRKIDAQYESLLKERREELKTREEVGVKEERRSLERQKRRALSEASRDAKGEILEAREAAIDATIEALIDRMDTFCAGDHYKAFLTQRIDEALDYAIGWPGLKITLVPRDEHLESELQTRIEKKGRAVDLLFDGEGFTGGFVVTSEEEDVRIDATLETYIEEHREEIGRRVIRTLEGGEG